MRGVEAEQRRILCQPELQPYSFNASFPSVVNHPIDLEKEGGNCNYRFDYDIFW